MVSGFDGSGAHLDKLLAARGIAGEEVDFQHIAGAHVADLGVAPLKLVQDGV